MYLKAFDTIVFYVHFEVFKTNAWQTCRCIRNIALLFVCETSSVSCKLSKSVVEGKNEHHAPNTISLEITRRNILVNLKSFYFGPMLSFLW